MKEPGATYLFNHAHFQLYYYKGTDPKYPVDGRIVRAMVYITSCGTPKCEKPFQLPPDLKGCTKEKPFKITYNYTVEFIVSVI